VSVAGGALMTGNKTKNALKIDLVFGVFHFIMPLLGVGWSGTLLSVI
jgi:putative Mn2+ efflux pump MntP